MKIGVHLSTVAALLAVCAFATMGCSVLGPASDELNPYGQPLKDLGSRSLRALDMGPKGVHEARLAAEVLGARQKVAEPKPYYPVISPAEVRLVWVPDHVDRFGNLVTDNYHYLKVKGDTWLLKERFDYSAQHRVDTGVSSESTGNYGSDSVGGGTPWVYKDQ